MTAFFEKAVWSLRKEDPNMFDRKNKIQAEQYRLVAVALAFTVAFLFIFSFATPAVAAMGNMSTISGEVIAVNPSAGTLTLRSGPRSGSPAGQFTFATDKMTSITSCAQNGTLRDIGVGQDVTVTYHEKDGKFFADVIEKKLTLALACVYP